MKIIHESKKRIRLRSNDITSRLNKSLFVSHLKTIKGVLDARVSVHNKSVVIYVKSLSSPLKKEILKTNVCDFLQNKPQEISTSGIVKSLVGLGVSYLAPRPYASLFSILVTSPILIKGAKSLYHEGVNSTFLESLAVGISLYRGDLVAANSTNLLLEIGEYIEEGTVQKSDELLQELVKPKISEVWVLHKEQEVRVAYSELKVGDIVVVNAGDTICVDGHVTSGKAMVNESSMTGESVGIGKSRGDRVLSGTVLEEGRLHIWAETVGDNTATARITEFIKSSLSQKSTTQQRANVLADKLVPMTLGLAGLSYAINRNLDSVSSVLQADYSCALKLATPVAFRSSIAKLGKNGIMVKGANVIEKLENVDTFIFDKTGTLTSGDLKVLSVESFAKDWSEDAILNLAASAEEHYFHPVAQAVVEAAKKRKFVHMHHDEVEFIVAHGVVTEVDKKRVVIGSRHFLQDDEKIDFSAFIDEINKKEQEGKTLLFIGFGGELLGMISLNDTLRSNAKKTLMDLKKLGAKRLIMLTGDGEKRAKEVAKDLGITEVFFDLRPTNKANIVKDIVASGSRVAFVGDGINDAPALVCADVGISMAKGADIAKASADVSLFVDDIASVVELKRTANETMSLIKRNFTITVGANSAILLGATMGKLSSVTTSILHNGTTVGLLLNSIRGVQQQNEAKTKDLLS